MSVASLAPRFESSPQPTDAASAQRTLLLVLVLVLPVTADTAEGSTVTAVGLGVIVSKPFNQDGPANTSSFFVAYKHRRYY